MFTSERRDISERLEAKDDSMLLQQSMWIRTTVLAIGFMREDIGPLALATMSIWRWSSMRDDITMHPI